MIRLSIRLANEILVGFKWEVIFGLCSSWCPQHMLYQTYHLIIQRKLNRKGRSDLECIWDTHITLLSGIVAAAY